MSFNVALGEAAWGKLLAWSALLLGLVLLCLATVTAGILVVGGVAWMATNYLARSRQDQALARANSDGRAVGVATWSGVRAWSKVHEIWSSQRRDSSAVTSQWGITAELW